MKQLTASKFFLMLEKASQTDITVNDEILKNGYDEFVLLLFSVRKSVDNTEEYLNLLHYTFVELTCLTSVAKKKCDRLYRKNY